MKLTFLGTSHGYAEKNRFTSGTLVEIGEHSYLIDAGAPIEALMVNRDKPYSAIRGIFLTHMHSDHVCSLTSVIEPFLRFRYNDKAACFFPEKNGLEGFLAWMKTIHSDPEQVKKIVRCEVTHAGVIFENEDLRVTAIPTRHFAPVDGVPASWSYLLESGGRSVLFTGDMAGGFPEYEENVKGRHFSLVVCEMAHADLSNVAEVLKKTDTDRMLISHYHTPRLTGYEEILPTFPFDVQFAVDGTEILV